MGMGLPQQLSPDFYIPSLDFNTGSSDHPYVPNNQFGDYICLGDLWNHQQPTHPWNKDMQSLINHPPTPTPTPTPTSTAALSQRELHSMSGSGLGEVGGDDFSKQVLVLECGGAAAAFALSQGGPIASSAQTLPRVARNQKVTNLSLDKQRNTRQKIGVEDLKKHFGKKRAEAAKCLDVSVPTLKRISRMCGIPRWPFNNSKNRAMSAEVVDESLFSPTRTSYVVIDPVSSMLPESKISSPSKQLGTGTITEKEEMPMTVKVQYRDDCVKIEIFSASKADLEKEISMRLKLMVGSYKIKYLDEEKEWISITCDADLQLCKRSLGKRKKVVRMMVLPSPT